jgi:hypothetical protein
LYRKKSAKASVTDHSCSHAISPTAKHPLLPTRCMVCCKENKWIDFQHGKMPKLPSQSPKTR